MTEIAGYETLQFSWGGLIGEPCTTEPWSLTHLVARIDGGTPGPTLCGIERFRPNIGKWMRGFVRMYEQERDATVPGWSVGGGLIGPDIPVVGCDGCDAARDKALPVTGLNASVYA